LLPHDADSDGMYVLRLRRSFGAVASSGSAARSAKPPPPHIG
jgi:hypothetical protein